MAETRVARTRIRAVRFKSGGEVRLLRLPTREDTIHYAKKRVGQAIDSLPDRIAGFAVVVWGADNGSVSLISVNEGSKIPSILAPDFVRNRLLASQIETWTLESLSGEAE